MGQNLKIEAEFPEKLQFLFQPKRYKVAHGGRGGAKSWGFARALLLIGAQKPMRIWCCREIQKTIKDSVHRLLKDQIAALGLSDFYHPTQESIKGENGTEFSFSGLKHNHELKSHEGDDIAWVEEAQFVSKASWEILIPTIRRDNSEIWVSFNPELSDDETYKRFVLYPPKNSTIVEISYRDNPFFPAVLEEERLELQKKDPDAYLNVWEGKCREILEGAVFAEQLRDAKLKGRICHVPYDTMFPVDTYWDLGFADFTSLWFVQPLAMEFRIIDFYQNNLKDIQHYLAKIQERKYVHRMAYLPHDADHVTLAAGGRTIKQQVKAAGFDARIVPRMPSESFGISAARGVFPMCYFDEGNCADGLQSLRHYRFDHDPNTRKFSEKPVHDWSSHASKAFMQLGMSARVEPTQRQIDAANQKRTWSPWGALNV